MSKTRHPFRLASIALLCFALTAHAADALPDDPAAAWEAVNQAVRAPAPKLQLQGRLPTGPEMEQHRKEQSDAALHCADLARAFTRKFPGDGRAKEARDICRERLDFAVRRGAHDRLAELEQVEQDIINRGALNVDERFAMRAAAVERASAVAQAKGEDILAAYEAGVRRLQREFPGRPEIAQMLYAVAVRSTGEKARQLAEEVRRATTSPELKESAFQLALRTQRLGQPLRIRFTAVDGRKIDTANDAGKVILIDFWATWSGPSIANVPKLAALRDKYQDQGLVILGISTDRDLGSLRAYIDFKKIPWPQCFDNDPDTPSLAQSLGVEQIPATWLIDRQGRLRDMNAGRDLESSVVALLNEPAESAETGKPALTER